MINIARFLAVSMFPFLITGCIDWVDDTADLKKYVAKTSKVKGGKIEPLPEFKPYNSFVYEGASMREPFRAISPVFEEESVSSENGGLSEVQPDQEREKDYLESFPVDKLRMVGTINQRQDERLWALIEDQNSEIHRVTIGDYMGLDHGEIISLDERQINLLEIIKNGRGGWMKRTRSLALNEPE
ncbi:pilus assembly protein PilP [Neptuniibacter sp. QD34_54]|uniref:pilus assembly protein PilP n=1 Tax=Neptuniibacter sp. QD34_54 TaxID=3398208 RepID=UPI0039F5C89A